jgi:hypothetical protein
MVLSVLWTYSPPDVAKPAWLRAEERRYGRPQDPSPRLRRLEKLAVMLIFAPLALSAFVIVLGIIRWLLGA